MNAFVENTGVDELIAATHVFDVKDRITSVELFAEVMREMNLSV